MELTNKAKYSEMKIYSKSTIIRKEIKSASNDEFKSSRTFAGRTSKPEGRQSLPHFQCNICQSEFNNLRILEVHVRNHLDDTPYRCFKCHSVFWSLEKLVEHSNVKHINESQALMCKFCLRLFDNSKDFVAHDMTHNSESGFDCLDCGKVFETNDSLVEHRQLHVGDRLYACRICDQRFSRADTMQWHIRKHNNLLSYKCTFCEKEFSRILNLSGHIQRAHKGRYTESDLDLLNNISDRKNSNVSTSCLNLNKATSMFFINQIIETLEVIRKYKCPLCSLRFVKEETVEIHCKRNHPGLVSSQQLKNLQVDIDGVVSNIIPRKQNCPACNELFTSKLDLVSHLRAIHCSRTPFKCSICGLLFARALTVHEHVETHFNQNMKCHYCKKQFHHKISLKKHIQRHVGSKIYECSVCNVPYNSQRYLDVSIYSLKVIVNLITI